MQKKEDRLENDSIIFLYNKNLEVIIVARPKLNKDYRKAHIRFSKLEDTVQRIYEGVEDQKARELIERVLKEVRNEVQVRVG
jgi:radical SAM superfamily enzyme